MVLLEVIGNAAKLIVITMSFLILTNTCLFIASFIIASKKVTAAIPGASSGTAADDVQRAILNRKQLKMTKAFCVMFTVFLAAFLLQIPYHMRRLKVGFTESIGVLFVTTYSLFKLSSVINPAVAMVMYKEFCPRWVSPKQT